MSVKPTLKRELGLRDLTLFAITCITSARWIPIAAHAGPGSVTLWFLAAVLFMVPLAVAVAALVAKYPGAGGLYLWTRQEFGAWPGFLCFWVYWMGIASLFPTAALLYIKVGFSMFGPLIARLGDNRFYLLAATVALIWIALGSNLIGLKVGKWTENIGALATWALGLLLVAVAWMVWMRRAGWIASGFATAFYVSATVAFLVVLAPENISELNGFAEMGNSAGLLLGATWISPLIALLVVTSGVGFVGGLGTATSRLPFAAGVDRLLPPAFGRVHPRWGTPYVSILALGLVATLLLVVYQLGDTIRVAYDELVSLMVITGFLPYFYIFGSAWKAGKRLSAVSGGAISALALFCSVVPPAEITNVWLFEGKLAGGTVTVVVSAWLVYRRRKQS